MVLQDYINSEKQEITKHYGRCDDNTIRKFIINGLAKKFHDDYLKKNNLNSLREEFTPKQL